jgi:hypothetical protein
MSESVIKQDLCIGGLPVHVYSKAGSDGKQPVVGFFLLHGRHGSAEGVDHIARLVVEQALSESRQGRDLVVVTFVSFALPYCYLNLTSHGHLVLGPQEPWPSAYGPHGERRLG